MQVTVSSGNNINGTLVLPLYEGTESLDGLNAEGFAMNLKTQLKNVLGNGDFKGKANSTLALIGLEGSKVILVGLGKQDKAEANTFREAGATLVAARKKIHGTELTVRFEGESVENMAAFAEGMMLRDYSYDHYKKPKSED